MVSQEDHSQEEQSRIAQDEQYFDDDMQSDYAEYIEMEREVRGE